MTPAGTSSRFTRNESASFFAIVRVEWFAAQDAAFRRTHTPLLAIRIIEGLADGIVRDDVDDQIRLAVVDELVRFTGFKQERVAGYNRSGTVRVPHGASSGNHMVKFPLRAVEMIRVRGFTGGNPNNLDIERMALEQICGSWV